MVFSIGLFSISVGFFSSSFAVVVAPCFSLARLGFPTVALELNFIDLNVKMKASCWYDLTKHAGSVTDGLMGLQIEHVVDDAVELGKHMLSKYRLNIRYWVHPFFFIFWRPYAGIIFICIKCTNFNDSF